MSAEPTVTELLARIESLEAALAARGMDPIPVKPPARPLTRRRLLGAAAAGAAGLAAGLAGKPLPVAAIPAPVNINVDNPSAAQTSITAGASFPGPFVFVADGDITLNPFPTQIGGLSGLGAGGGVGSTPAGVIGFLHPCSPPANSADTGSRQQGGTASPPPPQASAATASWPWAVEGPPVGPAWSARVGRSAASAAPA